MSGATLLKKRSIFSVLNLTDVIHSENIFYLLTMGCVYTSGYNKGHVYKKVLNKPTSFIKRDMKKGVFSMYSRVTLSYHKCQRQI